MNCADKIAKQYQRISFTTEKARIKGVANMIRSHYEFKGLGRNEFLVPEEMLKELKDFDKR